MDRQMKRQRMQPMVAFRALKALVANPQDTPKVFDVIRALGGPSLERGLRRFRITDFGNQVLKDDIDILDTLQNRSMLGDLPNGSFGSTYYHFTQREALDAEGLVDASAVETETFSHPHLVRYATRLRDTHDLWHTLTGYGRDELGEACLLAFTYAQTRNRGIFLIAIVGGFKLRQAMGPGVFRALVRAYRDGRQAAWLPAIHFESLLSEPITDVRTQLRIPEPVPYRTLIAAYTAT